MKQAEFSLCSKYTIPLPYSSCFYVLNGLVPGLLHQRFVSFRIIDLLCIE
jgi:hypothetical protein